MTKRLRETMNIPDPPDEAADAKPDVDFDTISDDDIKTMEKRAQELSALMFSGADHAQDMDEVHDEVLRHARDLMEFGFNIETNRARGIFEIAASMYAHAMTATNLKRDAQLKAMKLALEEKRFALEARKAHDTPFAGSTEDNGRTIIVEDRNELLRRLRDERKAQE